MKFDLSVINKNKLFLLMLLPLVGLMFIIDNKNSRNKILSTVKDEYESDTGRLIINEVMSSNKGAHIDSDGNCYDWVEIYNGTNHAINLKNYGLSDTKSDKVKWLFPDVKIESHGYIVVYLTKLNKEGLYASFSLKSEGGENLVLRAPSGDIVDKIKTINVPRNYSMIRDKDNKWTTTKDITPGFNNNEQGRKDYLESIIKEDKSLLITEILPSNKGNFVYNDLMPGYIELTNTSNKNINLKDYYISNDVYRPYMYRMEDKVLKPNEIYLLFTDKLNKNNHASFDLNNKNGEIYLSKKNVVVTKLVYKDLPNGVSLKYSDGKYLESIDITPGLPNTVIGKKALENLIGDKKELVISEVMNSNYSYLEQNGGKYYDWIELYNNTNSTINLNEYSLTEEKGDYNSKLPNIKLKSKEYIVFMASGNSKLSNSKYRHLDFKISNLDSLYLYHDRKIVDSLFVYNIPKGYSYGRNTTGGRYYFKTPTPGKANSKTGVLDVSYAPTFSVESGKYDNVKSLDIALKSSGTIYYTLDGTKPSKKSKKYTGPIKITKNTTIKAISYSPLSAPSEVVTKNYIINERHNLPVLSLTINDSDFTTLNSNPNNDIEKSAHVELLGDSAEINIDCGIKVFGGDSRNLAKKSFALKFRKQYGGVLKSKVFSNRDAYEYSTLVLRSGSQDMTGSMFKDELVTSIIDDYGTLDVQANKPIVLYVNNKYYGIYYIREKIDEEFIKNHYSVTSGTTNIVRIDNDVTSGSSSALNSLKSYVVSHDLSSNAVYKEVEKKLDIDNYIDLWIAQIYSNDYDIRNVRMFNNPNIDNGKIKMIAYDFDFAFEQYPDNFFTWMSDPNGMGYFKIDNQILINLLRNDKFKKRFLERLSYNLKYVWTHKNVMTNYNRYYKLISKEITRDHERWNISLSSWQAKCTQIYAFLNNRSYKVKMQAKAFFNLSDDDYKKYFES